MPPPGYYPPGPGYPQMPPPPPKRSRRTLWIVAGVVVLVVLVACIGGIAAIENGGKNTSNTTNGTTPAATSQTGTTPTTAPSSDDLKVGDTATFNNEWQVTINGVSFSSGDPSKFDPTPDANMTYLVVEGTFKNLQSKAQPLSTLLFFELRDSQGNRYDETLLFSITLPDGEAIPAGGLAHGKWPYDRSSARSLAVVNDFVGKSI